MIYYRNIETGRYHKINHGRVLVHLDSGLWARSEFLKPCDLAHYPFIGVNMGHPGGRDNGR